MLVFIPATDAADGITIETDAGVILLSTGPDVDDNWIRYYDEDDLVSFNVKSFTDEQKIGLAKCMISTDDSILQISVAGGNQFGRGLVSNGIGVRTKNNCATGNGQVDTGQSLTFTLNLANPHFDPTYAIELAEVDVEGKQGSDLAYQLDDGTVVQPPLNSSPDNGPDSGIGDNTLVEITPTKSFLSVTFAPTGSGKELISIEGGGDGSLAGGSERAALGVNQTLFKLVTQQTFDGKIRCEDFEPPTTTDPDGPALTSSTLTRALNTKEDDTDCDLIPYTFQIEEKSVYVNFLDTEDDGARFLVKIEWDPNDVTVNPLDPPAREVDYFDDGVDDYYPGVACVSTTATGPVTPSIDDIYGHPSSTIDEPIDPIAPGVEVPVCLAGEQLLLTPDGWQQIQWWDIKGDPRWR